MSEETQGKRVAPSSTDWNGDTISIWTMTSPTQTDYVHVIIPELPDCVPLYPLRYGLSAKGAVLDTVTETSMGDYPSAPKGKSWGLRLLRPYSFIYVMYDDNGKFKVQPYQVTDDGRFSLVNDRDSETLEGATPYLPAPKSEVTDHVYLMVTDTLLNESMISTLSARMDELTGKIVTKVMLLSPIAQQRDVTLAKGTLDNHLAVPEMASKNHEDDALDMRWSESLHDVPAGEDAVSTLERLAIQLNDGNAPSHPLAPILHDAVGILSELNSLLGMVLTDIGEYSAEASRKLRVRDMIVALGKQKYVQSESDAIELSFNTPHGYLRDYKSEAKEKALSAQQERLSSYRQEEADAFAHADVKNRKKLNQQKADAAYALWNVWENLKVRFNLSIDLHDDEDVNNFCDLRVVIANCVLGLVYCESGESHLLDQLSDDGPLEGTLMYRALMGHSLIREYVELDEHEETFPRLQDDDTELPDFSEVHSQEIDITGKAVAFGLSASAGMETSSKIITSLSKVIKLLPPDGASQRIGQIISSLKSGVGKTGAVNFYNSSYNPLLRVMEGGLLQPGVVFTRHLASWTLRENNGSLMKGFKISSSNSESMSKVFVQYRLRLAEQHQKLRFWSNFKIGFSVFGVLASTLSMQSALDSLEDDDVNVLVNSLNFGSSALLAGAYSSAAYSAYLERKKNLLSRISSSKYSRMSLAESSSKFESYAIGLTALAAYAQALSDIIQSQDETGITKKIKISGAILQLGAAHLGTLHLLGKHTGLVSLLRQSSALSLAESYAVPSGLKMVTSRLRGGLASVTARLMALEAGPVGWTLLAIQLLYAKLSSWHDSIIDEQRYTDWIARSIWGDGKRSKYFFGVLGGDALVPYGDDKVQELRDFDRLLKRPIIDIDHHWLKIWSEEVKSYIYTSPVELSDDICTINIYFPDWKPQVSWCEIEIHTNSMVFGKTIKTQEGRGDVMIEESEDVNKKSLYGSLHIKINAAFTVVKVKYYPNYEASPEYFLRKDSNDGV